MTQKRTSEVIKSVADGLSDEHISLEKLIGGLSGHAFCLAILIFAIPNVIPHGLPGVSTVCAIPIGFASIQMMLGYKRLKLPKWLGKKTFDAGTLKKILLKCLPSLIWLEKHFKPRMGHMCSFHIEKLLGAIIFILAFILFLPIPFGNLVPAFCICMLALGLMERDGALIWAGILASIATVGVMSYAISKIVLLAIDY